MLLNKLRQSAKGGIGKFIIYGFIALAVGGMVFMDVGGFFRGGVQRNSVAKIGREQISAVSFDSTVRRALYAQSIDAATAYKLGLIDRILTSTISDSLMYRAAHDLGLQVGDRELADHVSRLIEPMAKDGMTKKEVLNRVLMSQGMSEQQFLHEIRSGMATALLRDALQSATAFTPPQEARDLYQYQNEARTVRAVILPDSSIKDYKEPGDEVLLPFYQAGQERYAIPETRTFSMMVLKNEDLKDTLDISDEELQKLYEDNISAYQEPERRVLEQAVFQDAAQAVKVFEKTSGGMGMKDAVKEVMNATDSYLGEQTFQKDGLAKEIAEPAFSSSVNGPIPPQKTALGWHVIKVKDILPPRTQPFADVKAQIRKEALSDKLADHLYNTSAGIDDMLAGGETLEKAAESLGLKIKSYGPLREDGSTPDNKEGMKGFDSDRTDIMKTVYELTEGESAPVMQLADGSYAVLRVDSIVEKSYKPFDEVKGALKKIWIADQQSVLNKQRASDALRALAGGEKTMQQIADTYGEGLLVFNLKRNEDPAEALTPAAKTKFFEIGKGDFSIATAKDGFVIGEVTAINLPDTAKLSEKELKETIQTATQGTQDEFLLAMLQGLYDDVGVKINHALLQQMYGAGSEGQ